MYRQLQRLNMKQGARFWFIACIVVVGGLGSGLSTRLLQATLARSAARQITAGTSGGQVVILASDTFERPNQVFWGTASSGQSWEGDANQRSVFSIVDDSGQIGGVQGSSQAILGPVTINEEVLVSSSINQFDGGQVNFGATLRWSSGDNWYKVFLDGTRLTLLKRVNDVTTQLKSVPFHAQNATPYTLRFRAVGTLLQARVWPSGDPEPASWQISQKDIDLLSGQGGLQVALQNNTTIIVMSFLEMQIGANESTRVKENGQTGRATLPVQGYAGPSHLGATLSRQL